MLFSTVRTYLKNIAYVPAEFDEAVTSTGISVLRSNGALDPRYIFHFVIQDRFISNISLQQDGTLYPAVSDNEVLASLIPIAPLAEQRRIVAKVDCLSSRSKHARNELARADHLTSTCKRALLDAAYTNGLNGSGGTVSASWSKVDIGSIVRKVHAGKNLRCEERAPGAHEKGVVKVSAVTWGAFDPLQSKTLPSD